MATGKGTQAEYLGAEKGYRPGGSHRTRHKRPEGDNRFQKDENTL